MFSMRYTVFLVFFGTATTPYHTHAADSLYFDPAPRGTASEAVVTKRGGRFAAPQITAIAPAMLRSGDVVTVTGTNFGLTPSANVLTVDGVRVQVTSASATQLVGKIPLGGFSCRPQRNVPVMVRVSGATASVDHPFQSARTVDLTPGQVATPAGLQRGHCVEIGQTGGRYLISVVNSDPNGNPRSFRLRGAAGTVMTPPIAPLIHVQPHGTPLSSSELRNRASRAATTDSLRRRSRMHFDLLERDRQRVERYGPVGRRFRLRSFFAAPQPKPVPNVNDVQTMRIFKNWGDCSDFTPVRARVVYVGPRAIIF
jgi:hypothetical protein